MPQTLGETALDAFKISASTTRRLCQEHGVPYDTYRARGRLDLGEHASVIRQGKSNWLHHHGDGALAQQVAEQENLSPELRRQLPEAPDPALIELQKKQQAETHAEQTLKRWLRAGTD